MLHISPSFTWLVTFLNVRNPNERIVLLYCDTGVIIRISESGRWSWWSTWVHGVSIDRTIYTSCSHDAISFGIGVDRVWQSGDGPGLKISEKRENSTGNYRPVTTHGWDASSVTKKSFLQEKGRWRRGWERGIEGERGKDLTVAYNRFCLQSLVCRQIKGNVWTSWSMNH